MHPPFRLIVFLLALSTFTIIALLGYRLIFPPKPFSCGVETPQGWCGTMALEMSQVVDLDSMDRAKFDKGKSIFKSAGCSSCHQACEKVVGPKLARISERRKKKWIVRAIRNFSDLLERKDKTALQVMKEYKEAGIMPHHEFLTQDDIEHILFYLDHFSCN